MMSELCNENQMIVQYQSLRQQMRDRVEAITSFYDPSQPLKKVFALLHDDEELQQIDQELCELERLLPDWYDGEVSS